MPIQPPLASCKQLVGGLFVPGLLSAPGLKVWPWFVICLWVESMALVCFIWPCVVTWRHFWPRVWLRVRRIWVPMWLCRLQMIVPYSPRQVYFTACDYCTASMAVQGHMLVSVPQNHPTSCTASSSHSCACCTTCICQAASVSMSDGPSSS